MNPDAEPNYNEPPSESNELDRLIAFHGATEHLGKHNLYKIYLPCPKFTNHVFIRDHNSISFLSSFSNYFARCVSQQHILFEEDRPRHHYQFSQPDSGLLILLVPPDVIVCIDSMLLLQADRIIQECILGVYLNIEAGTFLNSSHFSMEKVRRWIDKDSDSDTDTDFDLPTNPDYA